jgi:DNA (cytosine-5)-methyltransferase 1
MKRALDLFCCAGGASRGLANAGFEVVGVDIKKQPHYPYDFIQADALSVPLSGGYDFIWASPPCQKYTKAQRIRNNFHPDLIAAVRARLIKHGVPFVIENVEGAPLLSPLLLCGIMFEELRVYRHRIFECHGFFPAPMKHPAHNYPITKMGRPPVKGEFMHVVGNFSGVKEARKAMGIDWVTRDELREAIPPAYSFYIASEFLRWTCGKGD